MTDQVPVTTGDGSHTLFSRDTGEHYHSIHGAIQESLHVFIASGYEWVRHLPGQLSILEIGFGTGLNCLLSLAASEKHAKPVGYTAIEPFPVGFHLAGMLNYCSTESLKGYHGDFERMHSADAGTLHLGKDFRLTRLKCKFEDSSLTKSGYHLVYFDAFSPEVQPELWEPLVFSRLRESMHPGGVLVTYCSKGMVRRAMQQSGFMVERLPGPPGKREMLRATAV